MPRRSLLGDEVRRVAVLVEHHAVQVVVVGGGGGVVILPGFVIRVAFADVTSEPWSIACLIGASIVERFTVHERLLRRDTTNAAPRCHHGLKSNIRARRGPR
jgi:hypothetical protein